MRSLAAIAFSAILLFSSNAAHAAGDPAAKTQSTLRIGFVPGPYADEFRQGVEPQLLG